MRGTSRALASLLSRDREGVDLPLSSLEMTDCLVCIFSARIFWVMPLLILASIIAWAI